MPTSTKRSNCQPATAALLGLALAAACTPALPAGPSATPISPADTAVPSPPPEPDYEATSFALMTALPDVTPVRPTGIFDAGVEFYHEGYRMQNAWQELVDGYWAQVIAGAHSSDPEQGLLFSSWEWPDAAFGNFYNTPTRAGSLRIVAVDNYRLTLLSENGTTFYWDVRSQSFVDSLTTSAPTITPPPTHTPTPTLAPYPY